MALDFRPIEEQTPQVKEETPHETGNIVTITNGKTFDTVDEGFLKKAQKFGWRIPTESELKDKDIADKSSALEVAGRGFTDELLFGVPDTIDKYNSSPEELHKREVEAKAHPFANYGSRAAGLVGNVVATEGLGAVARGAGLLGRAAEGAEALNLAGKAVEATGVASQLGKAAVKGAAVGAGYAAPKAVTELAYGDPQEAAETLLFGAGAGGLLGGLFKGVSLGTGKAAEVLDSAGKYIDAAPERALNKELSEAAAVTEKNINKLKANKMVLENRVSKLEAELDNQPHLINSSAKISELNNQINKLDEQIINYTDSAGVEAETIRKTFDPSTAKKEFEDTTGKVAGHFVGKVAGTALGGVGGHFVGGYLGHEIGKEAGEYLGPKIFPYVEAAIKKSANHLASIPNVLDTLLSPSIGLASGAVKELSDSEEQNNYKTVSKNLTTLMNDPQKLNEQVSKNAAPLREIGLDKQADAFTVKQLDILNYINNVMPKNPSPPQPFQANDWTPSNAQAREFNQRLSVINDPNSVLDHMRKGTLTSAQVQTLKTVYPLMYQKLYNSVVQLGFNEKYHNMPSQAKQQISTFMQKNLDNINQPQYAKLLQPNGNQAAPKSKVQKSSKAKIQKAENMSLDWNKLG